MFPVLVPFGCLLLLIRFPDHFGVLQKFENKKINTSSFGLIFFFLIETKRVCFLVLAMEEAGLL